MPNYSRYAVTFILFWQECDRAITRVGFLMTATRQVLCCRRYIGSDCDRRSPPFTSAIQIQHFQMDESFQLYLEQSITQDLRICPPSPPTLGGTGFTPPKVGGSGGAFTMQFPLSRFAIAKTQFLILAKLEREGLLSSIVPPTEPNNQNPVVPLAASSRPAHLAIAQMKPSPPDDTNRVSQE